MIAIRLLVPEDIPAMHDAFNFAFSDYAIPFQFTFNAFKRKFIQRLGINFNISCGAFDEDKLVGFIFNTSGKYLQLETAYNGGTGVIPDYRGRGLTKKMYDYLIPVFKHRGIAQSSLEVLTTNDKALLTYQKIGFQKVRELNCYKCNRLVLNSFSGDFEVSLQDTRQMKLHEFSNWEMGGATFLGQLSSIEKNMKNENGLVVKSGSTVIGYALFQSSGTISSMAVKQGFKRKGIGSEILNYIYHYCESKPLVVMNIDENNKEIKAFLEYAGFANQLNQYELLFKI